MRLRDQALGGLGLGVTMPKWPRCRGRMRGGGLCPRQSARRAATSNPPPKAISNAASSEAVTDPCMKAGGQATIPVPRMNLAVVAVR